MHKNPFFFFDISTVEFYKNLQFFFGEFKKQFQQFPTATNAPLFGSIILSFSKFPVYNIIQTMQRVYEKDDITLLYGDCIEILNKATPESVDMIFADPPYMLSNGGITCQSGKVVSV